MIQTWMGGAEDVTPRRNRLNNIRSAKRQSNHSNKSDVHTGISMKEKRVWVIRKHNSYSIGERRMRQSTAYDRWGLAESNPFWHIYSR